ncbi:MAG: hypothetical protein A2X46_07470 [Lentisphaerae bacterium GWF2_57_35]|nr:MAG: hypothetical protein A2X46_07470 [Lentisphaerae bacterium GWF2_57_35]
MPWSRDDLVPAALKTAQWLVVAGLWLGVCAANAASDALPSENRDVSFVYAFENPVIEQHGAYARVLVSGCPALQKIGEPMLPFKTAKILLPPGSSIESVHVEADSAPQRLEGAWTVKWGRTPVSSAALGPLPDDAPNAAIYRSDLPYPPERAQVISVQRMGGYDIALVHLFPVQYQPASGRLFFAERLRLVVRVATESTPAVSLKAAPSAYTRGRVSAAIDNPELLSEYDALFPQEQRMDRPAGYLLITRESLASSFQPLLDSKLLEGLTVRTQTVEAIAADMPGQDLTEKIRNRIRQAFTNEDVQYVLLGGDSAVIPPRYAYVPMPGVPGLSSYLVPTDLYFACLDGSWNGNGNAWWGEATDGDGGGDVDLLADVFVGRAPVDTPAEAAAFAAKTLRYETEGGGYAGGVLLAASYLGYYDPPGAPPPVHAQGGDILDPLLPLLDPRPATWLDDRPYNSSQWNAADAVQELNRSPVIAVYGGHGDADTVLRLYSSDLNSVTNDKLFFAYSVSCAAGEFDNPSFWSDCIGEEFVKRPSAGAFAAVFNSRVGWFDAEQEWKFSGEFQLEFFDELLVQGHSRLGEANQRSKENLVGQVETSGIMTYRWCYYEITLFGDPHISFQPHEENVELEVLSEYGGATPPNGVYSYAPGSAVTCLVTDSPQPGAQGVRYLCGGWSGQGSVPAAGGVLEVSFVIGNDSQIAWNWTTQYLLSATASAHGNVEAPNGWHDAGIDGVDVRAEPSDYCRFVSWQGDVPEDLRSNRSLRVAMNRPWNMTADFAENMTSQGVPQAWLAQYGWTNDWEAAAASDSDVDGMPAWQEFLAGTCPTDDVSVFKARVAQTGAARVLEWPSASNRFYAVHRATNLTTGFVLATNGLPATPPRNVFVDDELDKPVTIYRITVGDSP